MIQKDCIWQWNLLGNIICKMVTEAFKRNVHSLSSTVPILLLIEIEHPDFPGSPAEVARFVQNTENIISNGNEYIACAVDVKIPNQPGDDLPVASINISNVSNIILPYLEVSQGGVNAEVTFKSILASSPDIVQWSVTMCLKDVSLSRDVMSVNLDFGSYWDLVFNPFRFSPSTSPGIFEGV